jgi:hypothetical protein
MTKWVCCVGASPKELCLETVLLRRRDESNIAYVKACLQYRKWDRWSAATSWPLGWQQWAVRLLEDPTSSTWKKTTPFVLVAYFTYFGEPGYHSRYSDWLRDGRQRGRSWSPGKVKNFLFSTSRQILRFTHPPNQLVPGTVSSGGKATGAWTWALTSN